MAVISKPSNTIYTEALNYAELLRESDNDPHSLAHMILYLAERNRKLEHIAQSAKAYIQFGQDQQLHANLVKAIEKFEDYEVEAETMEEPRFGL
ncbi:MAG: hypothetical protein OEW63_07450 [Gammaproteobacteria bacterium]|nr:hypothetical protein [Gammaproteobacteria bacterium]